MSCAGRKATCWKIGWLTSTCRVLLLRLEPCCTRYYGTVKIAGPSSRMLERAQSMITMTHASNSCPCTSGYHIGGMDYFWPSAPRCHWALSTAVALVCRSCRFEGQPYSLLTDLPWWGFIIMCLVAWVFTFPNGILFAIANQQVGMTFLAEVIAGSLFHGKPMAVLTSLSFSRQILEQNLNLISDYKFVSP